MTRRRRGFSVLELSVVAMLTVLLALLIAQTWAGLGRPTTELVIRGRMSQEARLAVDSLSRDLGGSLGNSEGRLGEQSQHRLVGRLQPDGNQLRLCFDGGSAPNGVADWAAPDTVIVYDVEVGKLVRSDQTAGTTFVVARDVESLTVQNLGASVNIAMTFKVRDLTRTYTLTARDP